MDAPLVTVAIPLFHSRRFFDIIARNVEGLIYPNLEFLISDRHCADDTIDRLEDRFGRDRRVRFLRADDGIGWVEHYNFLLTEASGEYFVWMPHDDSYPEDYIEQLVNALVAEPEAVLAHGRLQRHVPDGEVLPPSLASEFADPPFTPGEPWTPRSAFRLLTLGNIVVGFRGVFRRKPVMEWGLFLRPTIDARGADTCWMFGLALVGQFLFVPSCRCLKRFYPESTSEQVTSGVRHKLDQARVLVSYLRDFAASRKAVLAGLAVIASWTVFRLMPRWFRRTVRAFR